MAADVPNEARETKKERRGRRRGSVIACQHEVIGHEKAARGSMRQTQWIGQTNTAQPFIRLINPAGSPEALA